MFETLIQQEKEQEQLLLQEAQYLYNQLSNDRLSSLTVLKDYKGYPKVLRIQFCSGRTAYININMNSVMATASVLMEFLYTRGREPQGFIEELYE